jgi:hypothetical protein
MTAKEWLAASMLNSALARAFYAAAQAVEDHENIDVQIFLDRPVEALNPNDLPRIAFIASGSGPGGLQDGYLSPNSCTPTMARDIAEAVQKAAAALAKFQAALDNGNG